MATERPRWYGDNIAQSGLGLEKEPIAPVSTVDPNDPVRYIFPSGEAAPGSNLSPGSQVDEVTPESINQQIVAPVMLASEQRQMETSPESVRANYNVPAQNRDLASLEGVPNSTGGYFQQAVNQDIAVANKQGNIEGQAFNQLAQNDKEYQRQVQDSVKREKDLKAQFDQEYTKLKSDVDNQKIDSRRWWKNKSTGDKVLTMVGMALSALSPSSFQNAMSAIDKTIERDINEQKSDIEMGRQKINDSRTLYAENLKRFGDERVALASSRLMNAEMIKNKMNSQLSGLKGEVAKANGLKLMGQIDMYAQKQQAEIAKILGERAKEARILTVPGYEGKFPTSEVAKNFAQNKTLVDEAKVSIDRLIEINKIPFKSMSPQLRAEANSLQNLLVGKLRVPIVGPGAMNESEQNLIKDVIANPTDFFSLSSTNNTRLNTLKNSLTGSVEREAKTYGVRPESKTVTSFKAH
jgi:hypothetical protein